MWSLPGRYGRQRCVLPQAHRQFQRCRWHRHSPSNLFELQSGAIKAIYIEDSDEEAKRTMVVGSTSSSRASGFPKIKNAPGEPDALIVSYTKIYNSEFERNPEVIISKEENCK